MAGLVCFTIDGMAPKAGQRRALRARLSRFVTSTSAPAPRSRAFRPGWWCTEEEVDGLVEAVAEHRRRSHRGGGPMTVRCAPATRWPAGHRAALCLSFDVDGVYGEPTTNRRTTPTRISQTAYDPTGTSPPPRAPRRFRRPRHLLLGRPRRRRRTRPRRAGRRRGARDRAPHLGPPLPQPAERRRAARRHGAAAWKRWSASPVSGPPGTRRPVGATTMPPTPSPRSSVCRG